ncbi:hypothetical protein GCM10017673_53660 [Streptosporangium violaceochromogenes]|nr:hypothetical protein GCM10017673_53660 [Streptosporangium violaceochromogenes]
MTIDDLPRRSRPDACPGALRVHAAADGGLARIRVPGGRLTPSQLSELARAASGFGAGVVELTSRANVQVRGLGEEGRAGFAACLAEAGLLPSSSHERVRNILASPLSGCDTAGLLDAGPLVAELDRRLCSRPGLAALPGRFLFALDDGRGDVAWLDPDAGILPIGADRAALILAGADSGLRVPVGSAVTALLAAAEAFLAEAAEAAASGATSPGNTGNTGTTGTTGASTGTTPETSAGAFAGASSEGGRIWRIGELPGGAGRVAARIRAALGPLLAAGGPRFGPAAGREGPGPVGPVGASGGPGGRAALGVAVPLGRLTRAQAELLAGLAAGGEVRLTPWRGVVLPGLRPAGVAGAAALLAEAGLVTDPSSPWIGVTACAGRPGCARALADVRSDAARATARNLPGSFGHPRAAGAAPTGTLPVHWAGCERRCGRPRGRVADVVAFAGGYRVELDGRSLTCADIEETTAAVTALRGET